MNLRVDRLDMKDYYHPQDCAHCQEKAKLAVRCNNCLEVQFYCDKCKKKIDKYTEEDNGLYCCGIAYDSKKILFHTTLDDIHQRLRLIEEKERRETTFRQGLEIIKTKHFPATAYYANRESCNACLIVHDLLTLMINFLKEPEC